LNIKELEVQTGLGRDAIRYYERRDLLGLVPRGPNNYRDYPPALVKQLRLLRAMQTLGFSLDEIREVLSGLRSQGISCSEGALLLSAKRAVIEGHIRELRRISRVLHEEQRRLESRAHRQGRPQQAVRPAPA
jgi:DNA-binding transcriptional MerR regulator